MKIFNNKKGIELSINFIVLLILAISVFAGGLVFTSKFFGQAEKMRESLDAQTEKQIEKLLDSGSPVVMPQSTREIYRNKFDTFGLGILSNELATYEYQVRFESAFDKQRAPINGIDAQSWISNPTDSKELKKNEKGKFMIGVQVPKSAKKGTYIYQIKVFKSDEEDPYDNPLQMIVKVP